MIWRCQIPIVAFFRALQPNSDRSAVPLEMGLSQARAQAGTKTPTSLIERFYRPFKHGAADGGTRLSGIMEREGRRWTALFMMGIRLLTYTLFAFGHGGDPASYVKAECSWREFFCHRKKWPN
jgi:hypothetical protein